jgi:uncharacterized delta-60 repeat protein
MAGTLDTTFGTNGGWTPSPFYNIIAYSRSYSSVIDSNGRILVTGEIVNTNGLRSLFVARYTRNGILDTSFGEDRKGWTATTFISGKFSEGNSIALDSTGKILVTGNTDDTDNTYKLLVARYTSSGILDTSFGEDHKGWTATTFISGNISSGFSIALYSTGKILVTGYISDTDNTSKLLVARYTSSGILDDTFGEGSKGWTATTFIGGKNSRGFSIALDSTGKILVTGDTDDTDNTSKLLVARYTSSGILDDTFGEGSKGWTATTFISGKNSIGRSIALDNTGKIVITGDIYDSGDGIRKTLVARYTSSGILDDTFGEGSKGWTATIFISGIDSSGSSMALDSTGKIVITGDIYDTDNTSKTLVARYTSSGILDTTFGENNKGWTATTFNGSFSGGTSIALDSTGKIVIVGYTGSSNVDQILVFVARYLGDPNIEPICLPAGTPIVTDQGAVNIELIDPKKHTIGHKRIVAITKTITPEKHLICFEKYTLGLNIPTKRTMMTPGHEVLYKGKLVQAKHFLGRLDGVRAVPYKGEVLYNVLQEKHGLMVVNNMVLETLHPENKVAKEILGKDRDL